MAAHLFHKHAATSGPGPERQNGFDADDVVEARHGRIVVRFQLENKAIGLPRLLGAVRSVQDHLEEKLAIAPRPVEIEIFSTRREWGAAHTHFDDGDAPSWVEGDSGRVIRIIMAGEDPAAFARLRLMVIHEVIHHAVDALGPTAIPAWLDEGLAICLSQDLPARYAEQLAAAADGRLVVLTSDQNSGSELIEERNLAR